MTALDLTRTYLLLGHDRVERLDGGEAFWARIDADAELRTRVGDGWLTAVYPLDRTWTTWEVHPEGDEILHATSGRFDVVLDAGERPVELTAGHTVVVPAGTWHTIDVVEPGAVLAVTFGRNTAHRPR